MEASQFWGAVVPDLNDVLDWVPEVDRDLAADREWVETDCDLVPARDLFAALGWARSLDAVRDLEPDFEVGAGLRAAFWLLRDFDVLLVGDFAMESLPFDALGRMPAPRGAKASCGTMISGPFGFRRFHVTGLIAPLSRPERMELPGSQEGALASDPFLTDVSLVGTPRGRLPWTQSTTSCTGS
jgi:hypothetical protein